MKPCVDLSKVREFNPSEAVGSDVKELLGLFKEAKEFIEFYDWCQQIKQTYLGMFYPGIVAVFLMRIEPGREEVDEWVWVVVGDLPPAYITCEDAPNPATALDAYVGAMKEWVEAATVGKSVAKLIPVNVPATPENARTLGARLDFLDQEILPRYPDDLRA